MAQCVMRSKPDRTCVGLLVWASAKHGSVLKCLDCMAVKDTILVTRFGEIILITTYTHWGKLTLSSLAAAQ